MDNNGLAPIFIFSPTTSDARMQTISNVADGFVYCVARKGVTGDQTDFSMQLDDYLDRCRAATTLPLALGFGVKDRRDIQFLAGKVDVAIIGTQALQIVEEKGIAALDGFIRALRSCHFAVDFDEIGPGVSCPWADGKMGAKPPFDL